MSSARYPCHVSLSFDFVAFLDYIPVIPTGHSHNFVAPVQTRVPLGPSVEGPAPIAWPPGFLTREHRMTRTVFHRGSWIALERHNLGKGLPHICLPFLCATTVLDVLSSSRKAKFAAGEVKADGKPIACCAMFDSELPTPMLSCGTIPTPNSGAGTAILQNSLLVGMHWIDAAAGWTDIFVSMWVACLKALVGEATSDGSAGPPSLQSLVITASLKALGYDLTPDFGDLAGNLVRGLGQLGADYAGDARFAYTPILGVVGGYSASVTRDGATGDIILEQQDTLRAASQRPGHQLSDPTEIQRSHRHIVRADGGVDEEVRYRASSLDGAQQERGFRRTDRNGPWEPMAPRDEGPASSPLFDAFERPELDYPPDLAPFL